MNSATKWEGLTERRARVVVLLSVRVEVESARACCNRGGPLFAKLPRCTLTMPSSNHKACPRSPALSTGAAASSCALLKH